MTSKMERLRKLTPGSITLLISEPQKIMNDNINILKRFAKKNTQGVYVTINQPYFSLERMFEKYKINTSNVFFIDVISSTVSLKSEKTEKCLFINSPSSLTELGIAIEQLLNTMESKNKFIIIDNITALLIYNNLDVTSKFIHFIINKIRITDTIGIIMSIEEDVGKELIETISSFCDKILKI